MARFNRVHAICRYLRDKPCMGCPAWESHEKYGRTQRGCYGLAKEVLTIAEHGNPWGPKAKRDTVRKWRKRVTPRKRPRLRIVRSDTQPLSP